MQKISTKASRKSGISAVTPIVARRPVRTATFLRTLFSDVQRWLAGRRAGIQIVAVQRGDYSIIT